MADGVKSTGLWCAPGDHQVVLKVDAGDKKGGPRMGNWAQWPLTESQVAYAAADAGLSYDVYAEGPAPLREALPAAAAQPDDTAGALKPSNGQSKRRSDGGGAEGESLLLGGAGCDRDGGGEGIGCAVRGTARGCERSPALRVGDTAAACARTAAAPAGKKAAHQDFFIAMRNRSIEPPMKGKKEHPSGGADALKGLCFVVSGVLDSMDRCGDPPRAARSLRPLRSPHGRPLGLAPQQTWTAGADGELLVGVRRAGRSATRTSAGMAGWWPSR